MSKFAGKAAEAPENEEEFVFEAIARAVAKAGVFGTVEQESLAQALARTLGASLGDLRTRLVTAGVPEDVVDTALKAGIVARASARFDFELEALLRAFQQHPDGACRNSANPKGELS